MSGERHCQTHPRNRSRSTDVPPLPVKNPHPQKVVEDWVVEGILPLHPEFFGDLTHIGPEAIVPVALRDVVVLSMLKTLKRIVVLFSREDRSMPTPLGDLKEALVSKLHRSHHHGPYQVRCRIGLSWIDGRPSEVASIEAGDLFLVERLPADEGWTGSSIASHGGG